MMMKSPTLYLLKQLLVSPIRLNRVFSNDSVREFQIVALIGGDFEKRFTIIEELTSGQFSLYEEFHSDYPLRTTKVQHVCNLILSKLNSEVLFD